jgi:hypothetical protein
MRSKRLIATIIAASVIMGTSLPVFAEEPIKVSQVATVQEQQAKITKDNAKTIAKDKFKEYFGYEFDETKFKSSVQLRSDKYDSADANLWMISWNSNDQEKSINLQATVDSNSGKVLSLRKNEYEYNKPQASIPSVTYDEAKDAAQVFLNKVMPEKINETKLMEDASNIYGSGYKSVNYNFNYRRIVNGIGFQGNYINVEVDGSTGKVTSFDSTWSENLQLPASDKVLDKTKAEEELRKEAKLKLNYIAYRSKYDFYSNAPATAKLIYSMGEINALSIDANTGDKLNINGLSIEKTSTKNLDDKEKAELYKKAVITTPVATEISSVEAEETIKSKLKEMYGGDYELQGISYRENSDDYESRGRKSWSANFIRNSKDGQPIDRGSITIDALTKGILSLYKYNEYTKYEEEFTPKLTWEEAYYKALDAVAKYFPERIKDIDTEQTYVEYKNIGDAKTMSRTQYNFNFQRIINGVKYNSDAVSVAFDAKTGELQQLNSNWNDKLNFVSTEGTMSSEEAENIIFNKYKPELSYVQVPKRVTKDKIEYETKLVYRLQGYELPYLDAFSGKLLDYEGNEMMENSKEFFKEIKGYVYEKELSILAHQGIIDTSTYKLTNTVTKMDLIKMLVDAKGYRPYMLKNAEALKYSNIASTDSNYKYLQMAVYYGIIENKSEELILTDTVTREEMAKTLVKLLGYDNLAKATDIFQLSVSDSDKISKDNFGYVAIAKGLGILKVENDKIRADEDAISVELAIGIYKVLGNLRNNDY